jgi:hypothetical protein
MPPDELEVRAHVEARLLGLKLLTLDAFVVTGHRRSESRPVAVVPSSTTKASPVEGGAPTLSRAVALLDKSSRQLDALSP